MGFLTKYNKDKGYNCVPATGKKLLNKERYGFLFESIYITEKILERPINTILDCACYHGGWIKKIHEKRPDIKYTGIDIDKRHIPYWSLENATFSNISLDNFINSCDTKFDFIMCMGLLYYFEDYKNEFRKLFSITNNSIYIETFCLRNENVNIEIDLHNYPSYFTDISDNKSDKVKIPSEKALEDFLVCNGFVVNWFQHTRTFDSSVGLRLQHPLKRSVALAYKIKKGLVDE